MNRLGEMNETQTDLAQVIRLALAEQTEDVRLFVARLVRKYRTTEPELAEQLDLYLRTKTPRSGAPCAGLPHRHRRHRPCPLMTNLGYHCSRYSRTLLIERLRCYRGTSKKTYCNSSRNVANQSA